MRTHARRGNAAFTLIELMIVVAIVGILAMLATYGVRKYISQSKAAEATNAIGMMANAAVASYEGAEANPNTNVLSLGATVGFDHVMCRGASATVPTTKALIAGRKYQSSWADWSVDAAGDSGFACLKFTMDQPQYYMYGYTTKGSAAPGDSFTCIANGDLSGDGILSTYSLTGAINSSYILNAAPNIYEVDGDE
jgi:type IV pilus assembly protein PilA